MTHVLGCLSQKPKDSDIINEHLIFYFAGHGYAEEIENGRLDFNLLPRDAIKKERETFINMRELETAFKKRSPHHLLVILDCCFAGAFRWSTPHRGAKLRDRITKEKYQYFLTHESWQVFASSSYDERTLDYFPGDTSRGVQQNSEHSPFALALIEGLEGEGRRLSHYQMGMGLSPP